jgi:5-methylcytosine-specific restriction endonuclease McrA
MEPTPAPKRRDYSGRVYKPRKCVDCPVIFTPGSSGQKRCQDCQRERTLRLKREDMQRRADAQREPRHCVSCGAELPVYRGMHSPHCEACRPAARKEVERQRNRERTVSGERKKHDRKYWLANRERINERARKARRASGWASDNAAIHRRRMRIEAGQLDTLDCLLSVLYRQAIKGDPCFYCGSPDTQCVDHYFAIAKGGSDRWFNLVRACRDCNLSKGTRCGTAFLLLSGG